MTRRKASIESLQGRQKVRKRTIRRYVQRGIAQYYKQHPKKKEVEIETVELPDTD